MDKVISMFYMRDGSIRPPWTDPKEKGDDSDPEAGQGSTGPPLLAPITALPQPYRSTEIYIS